MATSPPNQAQLNPELFPKEPWAKALIDAFNKLSLQVAQTQQASAPTYKTLTFTTGTAISDSFPIDIPVVAVPNEMRIAKLLAGNTDGSAVTPQWTMLSRGQTSAQGLTARLLSLSGLLPNTAYVIKLAIQ